MPLFNTHMHWQRKIDVTGGPRGASPPPPSPQFFQHNKFMMMQCRRETLSSVQISTQKTVR